MATTLHFDAAAPSPTQTETFVFVGRKDRLLHADITTLLPPGTAALWDRLLSCVTPGDEGGASSTLTTPTTPASGDRLVRLVVCVLPEACSRHNTPTRAHALTALLSKHTPSEPEVTVVLALDDPRHALAAACATARAYPSFSQKTGPTKDRAVTVHFVPLIDPVAVQNASYAASAVREAMRWVEMPPNVLHTDAFVDEARAVASRVGASIEVLMRDTLPSTYGGMWGVGRAAVHPPAIVVLSHLPEGTETEGSVCWVGKGIVYDTGGLSLKGKADMPGMKRDMGGAAAVLAAFEAAVRCGYAHPLHAVLCIAENAVGPEATRNDDILTMRSGKTVEVNNTDAEGRLVLADGLAHAIAHLRPGCLVDMATLTGAQLVSTGRRHAAIVCNDEALELRCVEAGKLSGDLAFPLPYCPEFFRGEFKSDVADLKNSVKDRMNAQSSAAGQFIAEHLGDYQGPWLHIDMAGPGEVEGRASGYGVGLLLSLFV